MSLIVPIVEPRSARVCGLEGDDRTRTGGAFRTSDDPDAVMHIYLPWSLQLEGYPPLGTKALCGHVRVDEREVETNGLDPRACVVCTDLIALRP